MKLKIYITALALLFINACNSESSPISGSVADAPKVKVISGWYMRTVIKATLNDGTEYIHKTAGVMGELKESQNGKDQHDIEAFGTPEISVVFPQEEWEEDNGDYFSDYRQFTVDEKRQVWTFQVKNRGSVDLTHAALQVTLEDPYIVYEIEEDGHTTYQEELAEDKSKKNDIILVDVDMQKEYSYEELETAQLSMEGNVTRTFRWVLGNATTADDFEPLSTPSVAPKLAKTLKFSNSLQASDDKFGLPPQL